MDAHFQSAKRKRDDDKAKEDKINNGINKYFNAATAAPAVKAKVYLGISILEYHLTCSSLSLLQTMQPSWQIYLAK